MKYRLRSLMIVAVLAAVVLGGRIEYLRRMAVFHEQEHKRCVDSILEMYRKVGGQGSGRFDELFGPVEGRRADELATRAGQHMGAAAMFRNAMYRPWTIVDEKRDLPNSSAPAPNPPKP